MKGNKRFFFKFGLIICIAVLIIGLLNNVYINGYYYSDVYGEVGKFKDVPYNISFAKTLSGILSRPSRA